MSEFRIVLEEYERASDNFDINVWLNTYKDEFIKALLIADKLMQEPSDNMVTAALDRDTFGNMYKDVFNAMRDQMIKEIDDA